MKVTGLFVFVFFLLARNSGIFLYLDLQIKNMPKKKNKTRLRWSLEDKKIIAQYQNQIDIFGQIRCKICGRSFPIDIMEVDHIKPISKGGTDQPSNLRLLCPTCNRRKNRKTHKTRVSLYRSIWSV